MRPTAAARCTAAAAVAAALLLAGCARPVAVQSDPGPTYSLEVSNPMPHAMIVSYDDGGGARLLGSVAASGQTTFLVTAPARLGITVIATDQAGTHTVRREVTLQSGTTARVSLAS